MPEWRIAEAARRAGVNADTLLDYERRGVIPAPPRDRSNYRVYSDEAVRRVRFVKKTQELGLSLREIARLLALRAAASDSCVRVREEALRKMTDLDGKIRRMEAIR